jgi:predicted nucleic acid-binding protein
MTSNTAAPVRVYVDSCGIIAFLLGEKPTSEAVQALLDQAEEGEIEIVVSAAILAEVRRRDTYDKAAAAKIDDLLMTTRRGILRRPMSITVGVIAREIGSKYGLSPMDALHLAVALHERVSVFYTTDGAEKPPRRKPKALLALNGKEIEWDCGAVAPDRERRAAASSAARAPEARSKGHDEGRDQ